MSKSLTALNRIFKHTGRNLLALSLFTLPAIAQANYTLDNSQSQLHFVSIKKLAIAEVHHFTSLSGSLKTNGAATFAIDLASAETNIAIRNQRLQTLLFNTKDHPTALFNTQINYSDIQKMTPGQSQTMTLKGQLNLNNVSQAITAKVTATKLDNGALQVTTNTPIVINSSDFNLTTGIDALRDIAGLPNINYAVPVTFSLIYKPI